MISMFIVVYMTYKRDGDATVGYGVTGLFATLFSLVGLILGILILSAGYEFVKNFFE